MRRIFAIEFPDECGDFWMNQDNLIICLRTTCPNTPFTVWDITPGYLREGASCPGNIEKETQDAS